MDGGGDQIFSRPGLAGDQHRHIFGGSFADLLKDHAHRHAHGDHAFEFYWCNFDSRSGWPLVADTHQRDRA